VCACVFVAYLIFQPCEAVQQTVTGAQRWSWPSSRKEQRGN